jgi:hypothetical protein
MESCRGEGIYGIALSPYFLHKKICNLTKLVVYLRGDRDVQSLLGNFAPDVMH